MTDMTDAERAAVRQRVHDRYVPREATPAETIALLPQIDAIAAWEMSGQVPPATQPPAPAADPVPAS